jgi:hypothetical protein
MVCAEVTFASPTSLADNAHHLKREPVREAPMLTPEQIGRFYLTWKEPESLKSWSSIWRKQFKMRTCEGEFLKLNRIRSRLCFTKLRDLSIQYAPRNLYMSALNWLMPERVACKKASSVAYPVGGEYVVDIDSYMNHHPHDHRLVDGVCEGCLRDSRDLTAMFLDRIEENYRDIRVVFSGKSGFHIHVLDFDVRDWTYYSEAHPLKSYEVARVTYTSYLQEQVGGFDHHHFVLSSDTQRVITVPESLNGETGLICSYLGNLKEFQDTKISDVLEMTGTAKGVVAGMNFVTANRLLCET